MNRSDLMKTTTSAQRWDSAGHVPLRRNVILVELNEITWDLIDPLIDQGKLPTFERLKREGTWAAPMSTDLPADMDPWITWTTLYTGRPQADHKVFFLQQPPE